LVWPFWRYFSNDFVSYKQYSESFGLNNKISVRKELKKVFTKR
jgi:hypothetical protein